MKKGEILAIDFNKSALENVTDWMMMVCPKDFAIAKLKSEYRICSYGSNSAHGVKINGIKIYPTDRYKNYLVERMDELANFKKVLFETRDTTMRKRGGTRSFSINVYTKSPNGPTGVRYGDLLWVWGKISEIRETQKQIDERKRLESEEQEARRLVQAEKRKEVEELSQINEIKRMSIYRSHISHDESRKDTFSVIIEDLTTDEIVAIGQAAFKILGRV